MEEIRFKPTKVPLDDVQSQLTGLSAVILMLIGALVFAWLEKQGILNQVIPIASELRYVYLIMLALGIMAFIELYWFKIYKRNFDFSSPKKLEVENYRDMGRKYVALLISFSVAAFLYWSLYEYRVPFNMLDLLKLSESWYFPFFGLFCIMCPICLLLALPYYYLIERYGAWQREEDKLLGAYYGYVKLLTFRKPDPYFYNVLKSFFIQFFFIPLMSVYFLNNSLAFENKLVFLITHFEGFNLTSTQFFQAVYACLYEGFFYIDLSLCVIGYTFATRLLDTHVRSAEPTLLGWLVTIACYQPINRMTDTYFMYNVGGKSWGSVLWNQPILYLINGIFIIGLLIIYVYATVVFGMRFSNLTNKGIISKGPYAIVRHPAYISKNLSWWLISLPFLSSVQNVLRLLYWNLIYFLRAITEERHLMHDPHYEEYKKKVRYKFIPFVY